MRDQNLVMASSNHLQNLVGMVDRPNMLDNNLGVGHRKQKTGLLQFQMFFNGCVRQKILKILKPFFPIEFSALMGRETLFVTMFFQNKIAHLKGGNLVSALQRSMKIPNKQFHRCKSLIN